MKVASRPPLLRMFLTPHDLERFQLLAAAALRGRQLEIEYWTASRNATGRRCVDPYHLLLADALSKKTRMS